MPEEGALPEVRFKRRKITHSKRAPTENDPVAAQSHDVVSPQDAPMSVSRDENDDESVPNLREIIRNRKKPRDRFKEPARKPELSSTELVHVDAPRQDQYTSRFVAQTGQIVDRDDKQISPPG